jgi:hypothetical protein
MLEVIEVFLFVAQESTAVSTEDPAYGTHRRH